MTDVSFDPRTGALVGTAADTSADDVRSIVARASATEPGSRSPAERRAWLYAIAAALEADRAELVALADLETALGETRLNGELDRTAGQLRFYGDVAVEGSYLGVTRDSATATTPELVRLNQPLGPVAVFGASNFPFAYGVLGTDTAAALAAGCPVVAKAHPAHLTLSLRLADLARAALPEAGLFQVVVGFGAGRDLVGDPGIGAVAFTGSQAGGLALWRLANERPVPVPVFAEMGTVNPVVVTRAAAAAGLDDLAAGFVASFTLGAGQYCTKPGLLLAPAGSGAAAVVARALRAADPSPVMLTEGIAAAVVEGLAGLEAAGARPVARLDARAPGWSAPAAVLQAPIDRLTPGSRLVEECFGPVVLVVEYADDAELTAALGRLQGSLAAAVFAADDDPDAPALLRRLTARAGRVMVNNWPTGLAYTWAQQHGGPWPSTTRPEATSVGAAALDRFLRPVTFQSVPDAWLPPAAQRANPWNVPSRTDGVRHP